MKVVHAIISELQIYKYNYGHPWVPHCLDMGGLTVRICVICKFSINQIKYFVKICTSDLFYGIECLACMCVVCAGVYMYMSEVPKSCDCI